MKQKVKRYLDDATAFLKSKKSSEKDTEEIRTIKGLIRRCEAKATCKYVGLKEEQIHFMNLPFYETGTIEKNPMGEEDIQITIDFSKNKTAAGILRRRFCRSAWHT